MTLHVDAAAEQMLARIMNGLRSERLRIGISQNALAAGLPVRGRAVSEWETGAIRPTLDHLILLADELGQYLVIIDRDGELRTRPARPRHGKAWVVSERRRLAAPLRQRRLTLGWGQAGLGKLVGVSRDSIRRWELVHVPPRPIAHVVWAQSLGYSLDVRPITESTPEAVIRGLHPIGHHAYDPGRRRHPVCASPAR